MSEMIHISVIIPAYNEAPNCKTGKLEGVYRYLKETQKKFELILVNDGSTDNTPTLLHQFAKLKPEVIVKNLPHQGKGLTVITGLTMATGDVRVFTDFDQSTPIEEIEKLLAAYSQGYDVVVGSREVSGSMREAEPWYRHLMGKGFNFVVRLFTVSGIHDTQCGFKLFSRKVALEIVPLLRVTNTPKKDAFTGALDVELLYLAQKKGFKIKEVPVHWSHVKSGRVSPIKDSIRMFLEVVKIKLTDYAGKYEV